MAIAAIRSRHELRRRKAIERFQRNHRAEPLLRRLSQISDQTLKKLFALSKLPTECALCAVGGYGRKELYPESDLDILILLPTAPTPTIAAQVEAFIASLWDTGLKAAHAVRTVTQCVSEARTDITTQTSLLDARWVCGSSALVKELQIQLHDALNPQAFFLAKRAEMRQRHLRYQGTAYALEPNCKESPGALRDLQVLFWVAKAAGLGDTWSDIAATGLLDEAELRAIKRVSTAFMRLRVELHLLCERREDRLLFDVQPRLAKLYGFQDSDGRLASEVLMQRYYWAARVVSQLNLIFMQELEEHLLPASDPLPVPLDDDFEILNHRLHLRAPEQLPQNPALLFRSFLHLQQQPQLQGMNASTLRAIWHHRRLIDERFRSTPENRQLFIQILQQPRGVLHALRLMTMLNILPRYLPPFRRIVGQMQHDLFHTYTVDQHTLMVIRNLRRFCMADHANEHPLAAELATDFTDYWVLYIAALFHDIAKGRGGNHSELGAIDAQQFCAEHGLSDEQTTLVVFLVREHLQMSLVAQKRDIYDPAVVKEFASQLPNMHTLDALYMLTIADIKGTNPNIWNTWKAKLLDDLYHLAHKALRHQNTLPTGSFLAQRKQAAQQQLLERGLTLDAIQKFWGILDTDYFLRHDSEDIIWHSHELCPIWEQANFAYASVHALGNDHLHQVMVYAPDRSDLFMHLCQFFDQNGLGIQDARIYTTQNHWALDTFVVEVPPETAQQPSFAKRLKLSLEHWLQQSTTADDPEPTDYIAPYEAQARAFPITPTFELSLHGTHLWKLTIVTSDRKGLLYSLAKVFVSNGINLKSAKIMTLGQRVEDSFLLYSEHLQHQTHFKHFERQLADTL
ncbi:[protein-PII] uridylyltransferase [Paenalcaligenes suwonensis]|uniref:[protein-PII] uridylyltransferase n=1 Tax=Paenalcaligenes suwonensis TaxID=1202713 RepID=UPI00140936E0|nr:[protein-PII] uridylyltransferase [Paenalcaligenes suwonensis]NHC62300.1 [protein-PII] uridylyltransferase [Paenalcaligenes suwonensis]